MKKVELKERLISLIPFELKRPTSLISIVFALVAAGFLAKAGELLLDLVINILMSTIPMLPSLGKFITDILTYSININIGGLIIFTAILFPIYRYFDKTFQSKKGRQLIFFDGFDNGNRGWILNYWGSKKPDETVKIMNSEMVFEATEDELLDINKKYGSYFDLKTGIYEGNTYEVECKVRADVHTTMKFQLWLHDTQGHNEIRTPSEQVTPSKEYKILSQKFVASDSNALRIHLHNRAGLGKIYVDEVKVTKI